MKTTQVIAWHAPTPEMASSEPAYQQLARMWKESWAKHGWTPTVVSHNLARAHPYYKMINSKVRAYPSHNGRNYETGCWVRWAAAAAACKKLNSPIIMSDTDVMNYGFTPEATRGFGADIQVLDRFGVPCMVYLTPEGAERLLAMIMEHRLPPNVSHWSDMHFFIEILLKEGKIHHGPWACYQYGDDNFPDWKTAPCVHFAAGACRGQGQQKLNVINSYIRA